ncbi:MAG TPA: DUF5985 family protein [Acetobacteraceae bacterium]|nr:DUF5985 family protein [Acetobacteraceae bacterium]
MFESAIYILCFLTSAACALLLLTSYRRQREPLLLWSALCFCLLALNNALVFIDIILLPDIDLLPLRQSAELFAVGVLLYGFVWESE